MRSLRIPLALATLLLSPLAAPASAASECLSIVVRGAPSSTIFADGFESGGTLAWGAPVVPAYSLVGTDDLVAEVLLDPAVTGDHQLELRWRLPGGQLYQSVTLPFLVGAATAAATRSVPGYPFPVAVVIGVRSAEEGTAGGALVSSALPVAGTLIVETGLAGVWMLEAYLDGSEAACGRPQAFRLDL